MLPRALTVGLAVAAIVTFACGSESTGRTSSSGQPQSSSPQTSKPVSNTPAPLLRSDETVSALGAFQCSDRSEPAPAPHTTVTDVRMGQHGDFDRVVIEFGGPMSGYRVLRQASTTFVQDASGRNVTVAGSAGLLVRLTTATSMDYKGSRDFFPGLPVVKEARLVGDFESVTSWGIGLSHSSCIRVLTLPNPARLVIDIQH